MELYLRRAYAYDKKTVYEWANDPQTRQNSFHTEPIAWESHEAWYDELMESMQEKKKDGTVLYICMDFMKPVGNIRIRKDGKGGAVISYAVAPEYRGLGYGRKMLSLLEKEAAMDGSIRTLYAEVKPENAASLHLFETLGYEKEAASPHLPDSSVDEKEAVQEIVFHKTLNTQTANRKAAAKKAEEKKYPRQANFELLRILAMLMVITLHYLSKGGLLSESLAENGSAANYLKWGLEVLCLASVNVYVLISGYFLADRTYFSPGKVAGLWLQIFFYSVVTAVVLMAAGIVDYRQYMDLFQLQFFAFPVVNGHYWFASSYLILYLLAPFLAQGMQKLSKKQHAAVIWILLVLFCFLKSVIPFELETDDKGNGTLWFLCLFLIAGYYRRYGMKLLSDKKRAALLYVVSAACSLLCLALAAQIVTQTHKFEYSLEIPLAYNFIFTLTASLGLFAFFAKLPVKDNALSRFAVQIAPYTFGVYLLHEHLLLRYRWPVWLGVDKDYGYLRPLHLVLTVLLVFTAGILADMLRALLFKWTGRLLHLALKIYYARKEVWDYLIFGALTTLVNWLVYIFCAYFALSSMLGKGTSLNVMLSNTIAWVAAVLFAYWTNKCFVFHSEGKKGKALFREFVSFVGARVFSFLVEQALMLLFVSCLHLNDLISKLIIGIVVIILNYIFSKLWIFRKK